MSLTADTNDTIGQPIDSTMQVDDVGAVPPTLADHASSEEKSTADTTSGQMLIVS